MTAFPTLLSPLHRGRLKLKNRIIFPAHQTLFSEDSVVGPRMRAYYVERAKGGAAAVVVEGGATHDTTIKFPNYIHAHDPRIVKSLDELAAAGRRRVVVAPLFLSQGAHLRRDLPALMKACESRHAGMQLRSLPALGDDAAVLEALTAWVDLQAGR